VSNKPPKTDEEWLAESADSEPLTKIKESIIGQLALRRAQETGRGVEQADGVEIEIEIKGDQ
jgi:hypothetical protein